MAAKLSISNAPPSLLPGPQLLHELICTRSATGVPAIEHTFEDGSHTSLAYDNFHRRADALARRITLAIQRATTKPRRTVIPLLIPQCPDLYISQLAILKAGGAFCPIVLDAPEERLRFILNDVEATVVLTTSTLKPGLPTFQGVDVIAVDDDDWEDRSTERKISISPSDAAYVMYTSGSTGQPKGVILSHSAACQALLAHDMHIPEFKRFLQFASPTFDVSVFEIFFPWLRGKTLVSCDRRRLLNNLPGVINALSIDACELTPSVASNLLRNRSSVPALKVLLTIGEMLKPSVVESFGGDESEPSILHGMYGPTEATIHCTLQTNFSKTMSCNRIGIPLDTVSAFVIRAVEGKLSGPPEILPLGEEGELAVGGYQLADGYLNRQEQTDAAFVQHSEFGVLYRTGDRARMLSDRTFECLGRISSGQVKLRGQRIELGEIEHAAAKTPGCTDVVAEVISNTLVAFCVSGASDLDRDAVTGTCRKWLPEYMVPGDVVILESFPYLASGKCDRKVLRAQYEERQVADGTDDEPTQSEELQQVLACLEEVLGAQIAAKSSLAACGLDSLSSIRLAAVLRKQGLARLDAGQLLTAKTPVDILSISSEVMDQASTGGSLQEVRSTYRERLDRELQSTLDQKLQDDIETSFPCTPLQIAMITETAKRPRAYCNWVKLALPQYADPFLLRQSLQKLACAHPLIRSGFVPTPNVAQSYAAVIWRSLADHQITEHKEGGPAFEIKNDVDLLRPARFLWSKHEHGIELLVQIHHALYDQWSMDLFRDDLSAILAGQAPRPSASFQVIADHHLLHGEQSTLEASVDFWQDQLRDISPTSLPLLRGDHAREALHRTAWKNTSLPSAEFKSRSQKLGCSVPAIFQTAMALVLGAYIGTSDVTLGSVFSGRTLPIDEIDTIFGPCLATLPLRVDTKAARTRKDLLTAVTNRNRQIQNHMLTSPTTIREAAGLATGSNAFDSLFVWQETTLPAYGTEERVREIDSADELEFNLVLEFEPTSDVIQIRATYQQRLISSEQVDVLISQIESLAELLAGDSNGSVEDLQQDLHPDLLSIYNPNPTSYAATFEITDSISKIACAEPKRTAIKFASRLERDAMQHTSITYKELDERANAMAHEFIAAGLRPESLVCICMEKCIDLYVAMLASFKAGAGYLPLVPETPKARIASILDQAQVDLCVCDSQFSANFQDLSPSKTLDISSFDVTEKPSHAPEVTQVGSRIAYMVFTSGSTGEPKGVAVTMDNLKGNIAVLADLYNVSPEDRLLQSCSQAFDVSVFEIFFTFSTGMCLCSATKDVLFQDFEQSIRAFEITHLSLTPTVAALAKPENVPSAKFLVTAGEGITEKVHRSWAGHGLHQGYGPSETTNICSVHMNVTPNDVLGNIGLAFKNTSAFVLAPEGDFQILPAGAYGEFAFGGEQVFRGYLGRDDLNSTKIIDHPEYGRIYRSGDMGRILPDGTLLISGRLDDQVKIRGNRVELGEINAVVADHAEVSDCATIVIGDSSANQMLATFWTPKAASAGSSATVHHDGTKLVPTLYERLEDALPAYMVPSILVPISRLPMTAQGKLDKRLLKTIYTELDRDTKTSLSRSHESAGQEGPVNDTEQTIAQTISRVLDVPLEGISRTASFFGIGMNSLNAIQLARSLQKGLGVSVKVSTILKQSSIARLSRSISASDREDPGSAGTDIGDLLDDKLVGVVKSSMNGLAVEAVLPCTPLQEAMLSTSDGRNEAYCTTLKIRFAGDMKKLKACWTTMTKRHAILRTAFRETAFPSNPFVQVVLTEPYPTWESTALPLTNGKANGSHEQLNGNAGAQLNGHSCYDSALDPDVHEPALPGVGPNRPVQVTQCEKNIYLQMHHAVYDGIAIENLFKELSDLYHDKQLAKPVPLAPFLAEVRKQNTQAAFDFWSSRVKSFEPHPFPPLEASEAVKEGVFKLNMGMSSSEMATFGEKHSCTSLSIFQAALAKTLACAQNESDICFGNVVSGRSVAVADIDRLVAPCFNTVPVRMQLRDLSSNLELIRALHRNNLDCMAYQLTALRRIQGLSRDPSKHLFDTLLLVQPPQAEEHSWDVEEDEDMGMGIPLVLEVLPGRDDSQLLVHYMSDKLSLELAKKFAQTFLSSLRSCLRFSSGSIDDVGDAAAEEFAGKLTPLGTSQSEDEDADNGQDAWTAEENMVRETFAALASISPSQISKRTSLYQIGLDSLNAVQVASQLRKRGAKIDAADVMQLQTPTALANLMTSDQRTKPTEHNQGIDLEEFQNAHRQRLLASLEIEGDALEAIRPCTAAQSGMLAQFVQSGGEYYFSKSVYEIPQGITFEQIRDAWAAVQHKHQVLRMGFAQTEDAATPFVMLIYKPTAIPVETVLKAGEPSLEKMSQIMQSSVFDALHHPAWRAAIRHDGGSRAMVLSLHHALYDADALELLLTEFAKALQDVDLGQPRTIDAVVKIQLDGAIERKSESEQFWKDSLQSTQLVRFPNLTPTIVKQSRAQVAELKLSTSISALEAFCRDKGVTIQAVGQTVWAQLLAAYVGEPTVTFGTVFSGLSSSATKGVAFPSIATLPVHCDTKQSSLELVHAMVNYNSSAQRHRFKSLSDIQRLAGTPGQPLFDTVFVYQKSSSGDEIRFDWNTLSDSLGIDYAVSMEMHADVSGELNLRLTHDVSILPEEHATLTLQQYDYLLSSMLGNAASDETVPQLMSITPPKEAVLPSDVTLLHQFLERGVVDHPDKPALEFIYSLDNSAKSRKTWTYRQLDERANQVANLIQKHSVQLGCMIAVCMSKCPEATFAFIGILKAGCSFLAMDPDLPLARRKFIAEDSASKLLFVDSGKADPEMADVVRNIELTEVSLMDLPSSAPAINAIDPSSTSYCLYTSGTTGAPKGCEITHENAVQAMLSFQRLFANHWTPSSRWLQFASYWFDVSVLEHFWSWSVGITMVGAPRDLVLEDLPCFINTANITHIDLTPSLARLLKPEEVPSLHNHVFITGGEALKQEIIDAWGPYHTIYNGYGPTEATIGCTMNVHIGPDAKPSNIGPAFDNVGAFVLAPETDQPVLRGAVGELCVSGKLVGKGYLNRPDLTAKAFPHLERLGERVYRTGDLVRLLADDSFSFIGRKDTQAKLRGQRLEIDEIDAVIKSAHAGIADVSSLVAKSSEDKGELLVSFIIDNDARSRNLHVAQSGQSAELVVAADQACRDKLPGYMVPTHIIPLSRLPLTVNNKVDAKRLVALLSELSTQELQKLKGSQDSNRPLRGSERKIAKALSRLLSIDVKEIGASSNVFSLGLSSVSAINLASLLKRNGFENASVAAIMNNPTVSALAKAVSGQSSNVQSERNAIRQAQLSISAFAQHYRSIAAQTLAVNVSSIEGVAPCTPLQEGLLADSIKSSQRPYFNVFHYRMRDVNMDRLNDALSRLHKEVPILRTSFIRTEDGFFQVILRDAQLKLDLENVENEQDSQSILKQRKAEWEALAETEVTTPFGIVIARSPESTVLAMQVHHALYDGISWDLMMHKLEELYVSDVDIDFGPSFVGALPYGPLCHRKDAKSFWEQRMKGFHFTPLPNDTYDPDCKGASVTRKLDATAAIDTVRKSLGVSHQAVFQTAFIIALHQVAPQSQTYGVVLSGRSIDFEDADIVLGPMFNTVPCGVDVEPTDKWLTLLQRCHQSNTAVLPFQHTSLRDVRKHCSRHPSDPMFDVLFVYQRSENDLAMKDSGFELMPVESPAEYPLAIDVEQFPSGSVQLTAASQPGFLNGQSLTQFMEYFEKALQYIVEGVQGDVGEVFTISRSSTSVTPTQRQDSATQVNGASDFEWNSEASTLRSLIAEIVGCPESDVTEHIGIFTLGLDSIDAVKLAARMKRAGLPLPVSKILNAQTIPKILESLQSDAVDSGKSQTTSKLSKLESQLHSIAKQMNGDVERVIPAAPGQEALIAEMIRSDFQEYFNSDVLRLQEDTEVGKLKQAWQQVVDASPILRTAFVDVSNPDIDATFAQVVLKPAPLHFDEVEKDSLDGLVEYFETVKADVRRSLPSASPLRLAIATIGTERYLVLSLAHAQYDGHSIGLLHADIAAAYADKLEQRPSYEPVVEQALGATSDDSISYWRDTLAGAKLSSFGIADTTDSPTTHRAERAAKLKNTEARKICQELGVSLQSLAQTAWASLLATYVQDIEVLFGVVLACRDSEEAEQILFPTMNTVPVRVTLHGSASQMLRDVQDRINGMRLYQRTPLRYIQAACGDLPQASKNKPRQGLFDTLFIYQSRGDLVDEAPRPLYESAIADANVEYPVAVEVEAIGDKLVLRAACKSSALDAAGTLQLLDRFDAVLSFLASDQDQPTVDFSGDEVSVCGLPSFTLHSETLSRQTTREQYVLEDSEDESEDDLATLDIIRSALAQVAKTSVEEIAPNATVQSMGIDSISAIKVASLLRKESVKLSVSDLVRAQTPRGMAQLVARNEPAGSDDEASQDTMSNALKAVNVAGVHERLGVTAEDVEDILPATAGQVYMLSMWQKTGGELFFPTFKYRVQTNKTAEDLHQAWKQLVAQRPILRTAFCQTGAAGSVVQVVQKTVADSISTDEAERKITTQPFAQLHACKTDDGFDLKLTIHHALYDAVSLPLLMQDLSSLLEAQSPAETAVSFKDYLALGLKMKSAESRQHFWTKYLTGVEAAKLRQPEAERAEKVQIYKPAALTYVEDLERAARSAAVSTQALFFAAYAKVYLKHAAHVQDDSQDVVMGVYIANRSHLHNLDQLAAPTLNLLPLRVRAPGQIDLLTNAKQIDHDLRQITAAEHSCASLAEIFAWTGVKMDTFINFLKLPSQDDQARSGGSTTESNEEWKDEVARLHVPEKPASFAMPPELEDFEVDEAYQHAVDVELAVKDGQLSVGLFCREDMMGLQEAQRLIGEFVEELRLVVQEH